LQLFYSLLSSLLLQVVIRDHGLESVVGKEKWYPLMVFYWAYFIISYLCIISFPRSWFHFSYF